MPLLLKLPWLSRLRARLPVLAPAEKSALAILLGLLASGAALRAWESSGVSFGPVDDWKTLRALVVRARVADATAWPCAAPEAWAEAAGFSKAPKSSPASARKGGAKAKGGGGKKAPAGLVDLNLAGERQLTALPGVGPSTAKAIVAYRAANGPFTAPEGLLNVKGIGPKKFEALLPYVKVAGARRPAPAEAATTGESLRSPPPEKSLETLSEKPYKESKESLKAPLKELPKETSAAPPGAP